MTTGPRRRWRTAAPRPDGGWRRTPPAGSSCPSSRRRRSCRGYCGGIQRARVERPADHRGAEAVVVGVERRGHRARSQRAALRREIRLEGRLGAISLVARPAEVRRPRAVVDLLPGVPADVAEVDLVGPRAASRTRTGCARHRARPSIARSSSRRRTGCRAGAVPSVIDAQDLPVRAVRGPGRAASVAITVGAIADPDEQGAVVARSEGTRACASRHPSRCSRRSRAGRCTVACRCCRGSPARFPAGPRRDSRGRP